MRNVMRTALLLAALAVLPSAGWCAARMAAVVVFAEGDVQLVRAGSEKAEALAVNTGLEPGDAVKTGPGAKASLVTKGGAEIRINENSTFEVPGKNSLRETYELKIGQVWSRMLHKMGRLSVRTPSAVCAIRGTEADIEQKDIMTVKVYEGHVELKNALGRQALKAGQMSTASAAAAPAAPKQMTQADMGKWQEGINVKDIGRYLQVVDEGGQKKLKLVIDKGGQTRQVDINLKKK